MNTYKWLTTNLYTETVGTELEYVVVVYCDVIGTDTVNPIYTFTTNLITRLVIDPDQPDYIPYDELTNEIVIGWVKDQLGETYVDNIYISIDGNIESQINPPVSPTNTPLPF